MFTLPIIGSNQNEEYNQLILSDIIEARLVEIFELVQSELKKMGVDDLPGGYVITGGTANMQGLAELAKQCSKIVYELPYLIILAYENPNLQLQSVF